MYPVVTSIESQTTLIGSLNRDLNVESDCESDSTGVARGPPGVKTEEGGEIRDVLMTGSFSAYVHFPASPSGLEK